MTQYFSLDEFVDGSSSRASPRNFPAPLVNGSAKPSPVDIGPYTKIPNRFFGSGLAARLGTAAGFLYVALCDHANRKSSLVFKVSDKALAADTGIAPRTICKARCRLMEHDLLSYTRSEGQTYQYSLKPLKLEWKPIHERLRPAKRPRAYGIKEV